MLKRVLKILGGLSLGVLSACNLGGNHMKVSDFFKEDMVELIRTIQKGDKAQARTLIEGGLSLNVHGEEGITPLFYLMMKKDKPAMRLALCLGADPNMTAPDGASPLGLIAGSDDDEMIRILLEHGADPNTKNRDGEPVMFDAIGMDRLDQIELLIQYGADVNLADRTGANALLYCSYINKYEIAYSLIVSYGADFKIRDATDADIAWMIHDSLTRNLLNPQYPAHGWALKVKQELIDRGYPWPPLSPREVRWAENRPNKFDLEARQKEERGE